jgi:hypothetical protein
MSDDFVDDLVLGRMGRLRRNKVSGGRRLLRERRASQDLRLPNHHLAKPDQNGKYKAQIPTGHGSQFDGVNLVMRESAKCRPCALHANTANIDLQIVLATRERESCLYCRTRLIILLLKTRTPGRRLSTRKFKSKSPM